MNSVAVKGLCLALFGALTIGFGHLFGLDLDQVALLGVALGGVEGQVPDRTLTRRIGGFLVGFAVAWVGYAMRAGMLPDTAAGRAVTVFGVIVVLVAVAAVSAEHVPLWAMLVGSAAMVGAYEQTYAASPSLFLSDSPTAATTVLLAVALGVTGSMLIGEPAEKRESVLRTRRRYTGPKAVDSTESVA
jgi:hypothetical protein